MKTKNLSKTAGLAGSLSLPPMEPGNAPVTRSASSAPTGNLSPAQLEEIEELLEKVTCRQLPWDQTIERLAVATQGIPALSKLILKLKDRTNWPVYPEWAAQGNPPFQAHLAKSPW